MDFLREYGAIIDLRERCITFSTKRATAQTDVIGRRSALRVSDDSITIPPRASVMVSVKSDELDDGEAIVEGNISMLLTHGICVARSLVELRDSQTAVLVTNFTFEHRHIFRGTAVAYAEPSTDIVECFASEVDTDDSSLGDIDVNSELMDDEKSALQELLNEFRACFARSTKVGQTPITKHRITTSDDARPIKQQPYRVSPKEREAIQAQVKEMLDDGVIQPSHSPWSSPVVLVKKKTERFDSVLIIDA